MAFLAQGPDLGEVFGWQLGVVALPAFVALVLLRRFGAQLVGRNGAANGSDAEVRAGWGVFDCAFVALICFGAIAVSSIGLSTDSGTDATGGPVGIGALIRSAIALTITAIAAALVAARYGAPGLRALGLRRGGNGRAGLFGVLAYFASVPVLLAAVTFWPVLARRVGIDLGEQEVLVHILSLEGSELVVAAVLATSVIPFLEEFLFRGFLQPVLVARVGAAPAVVLTSVGFGALHGSAAAFPVFVLSLLLGWLQVRSGRLTSAWVAHGLHNGLTLTVALYAQELVASTPS